MTTVKKMGKCKVCSKTFLYYASEKSGKFCSHKCFWSTKTLCKYQYKWEGKKHKPETIAKMKLAQVGTKHWKWGGKNICYTAIHKWVQRHKGVPKFCVHCGTTDPKMTYEWANVSRKYLRDLNDFIRLCTPCHKKFDKNHNQNVYPKRKNNPAS